VDGRVGLWYNDPTTEDKEEDMGRFARIAGLVVLLVGVGLSGSGLAAPEAEPEAMLWEVGTQPACDFSTIGAAIAAANPGDTIKVENLVYTEGPLTINKNLTLKGSYLAAGTPFACLTNTGFGYTTLRRSGTTAEAILEIQGADVTISWFIFEGNHYEAGLETDGATLDLQNCILRDNWNSGMYVHGVSDVTLNSVEISENEAPVGGGLWIGSASQVVADNTVIRDNSGWNYGAGVYLQGSSDFTARNGSSIVHNRTFMGCDEGGGIYARNSGTEVLIDASDVISNTALEKGGGLYLTDGAVATIQNFSWIQENGTYGPAVGGGGGVHVDGTGTTLNVYDSIFYLNWSDPDGAGIWNEFGTVNLDGAILMYNNAAQRGGGMFTSFGPATVRNSLFLYNKATYDSGGGIATYRSELTVHRSYFSDNESDEEGSAIYVEGANGAFEPAAEIVNCFLVDNPTTARSSQEPEGDGPALGDWSPGGRLPGGRLPGEWSPGEWSPGDSSPREWSPGEWLPGDPSPGESSPGESSPGALQASGSTLYVEGTTAQIVHNTLAHANQVLSYGVYVGDGSGLSLENNIITGFYTGIHRPPAGTGTATSDHDLFWANGLDFDAAGITVIGPVYGTPGFVSPGSNYHLGPTSWAIDMGKNAGVYMDYDGDLRPWAGGFDIGADEYPDRERVYLPFIRR
jgi:hypothetical protein